MEKLKELISLCKCSVNVEVNPQRDFYQSADGYISELSDEDQDEISEEVKKVMIERDTIILIQAYPRTPIGFLVCYHYDLDTALDIVIEAIKN